MLKRFLAALVGRHFWLKLKRQFDLENGNYAVFMPDDDDELNNECLRHMDDMLIYKKGKGAVILSYKNNIKSDKFPVVDLTQKEFEYLLAYYELCNFSESFVLVSLIYPKGNDRIRAIGKNDVRREDIVCLCFFCIRNFSR